MSENEELKPCPNGLPLSPEHDIAAWPTPWGPYFYVICGCGWRGPVRDTESDAWRAWNARAEPAPLDEVTVRLEDGGKIADALDELRARVEALERSAAERDVDGGRIATLEVRMGRMEEE